MANSNRPFIGTAALQAGTVSRWQLRTQFDRVHPDVYLQKGARLDARLRAMAAAEWSRGRSPLVGFSAAALHGTKWIDPNCPAELAVDGHTRTPRGIVGRRDALTDRDLCKRGSYVVTTPARTAFDIGRRARGTDAVVALDALCNATGLAPIDVYEVVARNPGRRGLTDLRVTLDLVDGGAESPQETSTRLLLIDNGLPRPETQIRIHSASGALIARADMGWSLWKVAVEYDGGQHWLDPHQRTWDIDRAAMLDALGWRVVRVSAALLAERPHDVVARTLAALRAAGAPV